MEALLGIIVLIAAGLGVVGWLWIVIKAFSEGETLWGVGCLIISPLCLVYGIMNFDELKIPVLFVAGGIILKIALSAAAFAIS